MNRGLSTKIVALTGVPRRLARCPAASSVSQSCAAVFDFNSRQSPRAIRWLGTESGPLLLRSGLAGTAIRMCVRCRLPSPSIQHGRQISVHRLARGKRLSLVRRQRLKSSPSDDGELEWLILVANETEHPPIRRIGDPRDIRPLHAGCIASRWQSSCTVRAFSVAIETRRLTFRPSEIAALVDQRAAFNRDRPDDIRRLRFAAPHSAQQRDNSTTGRAPRFRR